MKRFAICLTGLFATLLIACDQIIILPEETPLPAAAREVATASAEPTPRATATPTVAPSPTETATRPLVRPEGIGEIGGEPSAEFALFHVQQLAVAIGSRPVGSPEEAEAARYIAAQLEGYGYATEIQEFEVERWQDEGSSLRVDETAIAGDALFNSLGGSVRGLLVPSGIGRPDEFPAAVEGNIALIERGTLTFQAKAENAAAAGAIGVVVYNNRAGPIDGAMREAASIPVLGISREDGEALLIMDPELPAELDVQAGITKSVSRNVIADSNPALKPTVLLGAHMDSIAAGPGANDNASGAAVVIELARALAGSDYPFNIRLMTFGGEEIGLLGSGEYLDSSSTDSESIIAMLNFDMVGVGTTFRVGGDETLAERARAVAAGIGVEADDLGPARGGSDHASFLAAGIPSIFYHWTTDPNYHTPNDEVVYIQPENLEKVMLAARALIEDLANDRRPS